jgi:hypothetical protein
MAESSDPREELLRAEAFLLAMGAAIRARRHCYYRTIRCQDCGAREERGCNARRCRDCQEEHARALRRERRQPREPLPTKCSRCGTEFPARRSTAKFCSPKCRVAWNRAAARAEK